MEISNHLQQTSNLLSLLSENTDVDVFPAQLTQKKLLKIKKDLFQKNSTSSLKINGISFDTDQGKESLNFNNITNNFNDFQNKFNLRVNNIQLFDPQTLNHSSVIFNKKPMILNFVVNNLTKDLNKVVNYIHEILFKLPFSDHQSKLMINIIIVNFFENISGIKQNKQSENNKNYNFVMTTYSELRKIININFSELPYYFFTNKFMKVINHGSIDFSDVQYNINNITNFLAKNKINKNIVENKIPEKINVEGSNYISAEIYSEFKRFLKGLNQEFHSRKNNYSFNCIHNIKIYYEKQILFNSHSDYKIYYTRPIIYDNSFSFIGSRVQKLLLDKFVKDNLIVRRFKIGKKSVLTDTVSKFFSFLNELGLKTYLELRKKTNYNFENVSKQYIIKNSIGKLNNNDIMRTYNIQSIFQKLKDLKKSTMKNFKNENFSFIKNVRLKLSYKMFKSKLTKSMNIECKNHLNSTVNFEIIPGTNYLISILKGSDIPIINRMFSFFMAMKKFCQNENLTIEFSVFVVTEEVSEKTINDIKNSIGDYHKYVSLYFIESINSSKRLYDYVYEYPNNKNYLFIDSEGRFNNFSLRSNIYTILEKLYSLLNKKFQIDKETYSKLKKVAKKNIPDYDYSQIKYKPTINFSLEKRTIYNDKMNITDTKYFVKGDLKINDVHFQYLSNLLSTLKEATDRSTDFIEFKRILPTFTIPLKSNNSCHYCHKDCGNFNLYFCGYCKVFICEKCGIEIGLLLHQKEKIAKEKEDTTKSQYNLLFQMFILVKEKGVDKQFQKFKQCVYHNLILVTNVEKVLKAGTNLTFNYSKLGYNIFSEFLSKEETKNNYICSLCSKTYFETKYCCLNCKSFDYYYDTYNDMPDFSGFIDICEKCFKNINEYDKTNQTELNLSRMLIDQLVDNENHIHSEHIYARFSYNSGFYFIN